MNIIKNCPSCGEKMLVSRLKCKKCDISIDGDFEENIFSKLDENKIEFLLSFIKNRGNLKLVQKEKGVHYFKARDTLNDIIKDLGLEEEEKVMLDIFNNTKSTKASDIIRAKLIENGGTADIESMTGKVMTVALSRDGEHFNCDKLPLRKNESLKIFDCVVELLDKNNGKAMKGNGRNYKLGEKGCELDTVAGYIGSVFDGHNNGESILDPVFAIAAIMDWADIINNRRGYIEYSFAYRKLTDK